LQVANEKQEPSVDKSATRAENWDLGFSTSTFLVKTSLVVIFLILKFFSSASGHQLSLNGYLYSTNHSCSFYMPGDSFSQSGDQRET